MLKKLFEPDEHDEDEPAEPENQNFIDLTGENDDCVVISDGKDDLDLPEPFADQFRLRGRA